MKKCNITIILMFILSIAIIPSANASSIEDLSMKEKFSLNLESLRFNNDWNKYLKNKYGENYKNIFLNNANSVEKARKLYELFKISNQDKIIYPDFFGGLYIDENEKLIIQIVKKNIPDIRNYEYEIYEKMLEITTDAVIKYVSYSYNELESLNKSISDYYLQDYPYGDILSVYLDIFDNRVVVELDETIDDAFSTLTADKSSSQPISFIKGEKNVDYSNLLSGSLLIHGNKMCSFGYRAKLGGKNGIVTAGHCTDGINSNSGYGIVKKWQKSGQIDASWIETTSTYTPSNSLSSSSPYGTTGQVLTRVTTWFVAGQRIGKVGAASGWTDGKVVSTSYTSGGLSGLVSTDFWAQEGDSGGIVFENPTSGALGYATAGIVKGGPEGGGNFSFSRADKINSTFNITRY